MHFAYSAHYFINIFAIAVMKAKRNKDSRYNKMYMFYNAHNTHIMHSTSCIYVYNECTRRRHTRKRHCLLLLLLFSIFVFFYDIQKSQNTLQKFDYTAPYVCTVHVLIMCIVMCNKTFNSSTCNILQGKMHCTHIHTYIHTRARKQLYNQRTELK